MAQQTIPDSPLNVKYAMPSSQRSKDLLIRPLYTRRGRGGRAEKNEYTGSDLLLLRNKLLMRILSQCRAILAQIGMRIVCIKMPSYLVGQHADEFAAEFRLLNVGSLNEGIRRIYRLG
jgi:hypothetical protein